MKSLILALLLMVANTAFSLGVRVEWTAPCQSSDMVASYNVYMQLVTGTPVPTYTLETNSCAGVFVITSYIGTLDLAKNTTNICTVITNLLPEQQYIFAVSAIDTFGVESDLSSQVLVKMPDVYTNGMPFLMSFNVISYATNWYNPPYITTNADKTLDTNYFSVTPYLFRYRSPVFFSNQYSVLTTTNLSQPWQPYAVGSNDVPSFVVTNNGGNAFFKLQIIP